MSENPQLRRGPSGPMAEAAEGATFEPFDNSYYYDPEYVDGAENGSIAGPFVEWGQLVALTMGGSTDGVQFYLPGYPVLPTADVVGTEKALVFQGQKSTQISSYITGFLTFDSNGGTTQSVTFRDVAIEGIHLAGGSYPLTFERCEVGDIDETSPGNNQLISGFDCAFLIGQVTPDNHVRLQGGYVVSWEANTLQLTDLTVGTVDLVSSGELFANGTSIICRGVTFAPGSTVEFLGAEGELFLDPESYKSFLDNDIDLTNGHVTRLDGSWPRDAIVYDQGEDINFTKNPRAIYNAEDTDALVFLPPLTREVQLLVVYTAGGEGGPIGWPSNVFWTEGLPPEQITTLGSMSLFRFDYEEDLDIYFGWVAGMDFQGP